MSMAMSQVKEFEVINVVLFLVYESYEISRRRNQNLKITTKATKFLGDLEINTKSEILR